MLEYLRRGAKSWTAKILFLLLIVSFAVWGVGDVFGTRQANTVAQVGEAEVAASALADALSRQQAALSREAKQVIGFDTLRAVGLDRQVLAALIRDAALGEELRTLGVRAPDTAVAAQITRTAAFQGPGGAFSDATYRSLLRQQGFSPAEFEELTRGLIGQQLISGAVGGGARPQPGAATRIAAREGETRTVDVLRLTPALAPDPGTPDDAAVSAFYDANPALFTLPERRTARALHVDIAALVADLIPDEAAARAAYDANIGQYTAPPRATIDQLSFPDLGAAEAAAARLASGTGFDDLAADLGQAAAMGLGEVTPADLPQAVADAVFAATAPGVVGPVASVLGAVLVRVTAITPGFVTPFEIVGPVIRESLARDAAANRAPEIANRIEELRAEGRSLEEIAADTGLAIVTMTNLARDGTLPDGSAIAGVAGSPEVLDELFTAEPGEERDILTLPDGGYLVLAVDAVAPSALPPQGAVRAQVVAAWQARQRLAALGDRGAQIVAQVAGGATLAQAAQGLGRGVTSLDPFTAAAPPPDLPAPLVAALFGAAMGDAVSGAAPASATEPAGVLVVEVTGVTPMASDALAEATARLDQQLTQSLAQDQVEYFARAVEARIGVGINPDAIEGVFRSLGAATPGTGG